MDTNLCVCECAHLSLVLQRVVSQLMAGACGEIQPAALVQHLRWFPLPLVKKSGNEQKGCCKRLNASLQTQKLLSKV